MSSFLKWDHRLHRTRMASNLFLTDRIDMLVPQNSYSQKDSSPLNTNFLYLKWFKQKENKNKTGLSSDFYLTITQIHMYGNYSENKGNINCLLWICINIDDRWFGKLQETGKTCETFLVTVNFFPSVHLLIN